MSVILSRIWNLGRVINDYETSKSHADSSQDRLCGPINSRRASPPQVLDNCASPVLLGSPNSPPPDVATSASLLEQGVRELLLCTIGWYR